MKKILIVDDAPFMRKVASDILSTKYETILAASGPEAIELYKTEEPDMILSDLIMPDMTGLELQRRLSEQYNKRVPFMFMTADEHEEPESMGLEAGAMDYIRKPFKPDILLHRVGNIMRHLESLEQIRGLQISVETDPMTGLLNKTFVQKALTDICRHSSGTLMMIDLDSFKLVNDLYGHSMGDRILIRFAEILHSVIRSSDLAGRMGGDEFIAFCRDVKSESLIAERSETINRELMLSAKEFMGEDMNIPLGASIGAVAVPDEGSDFASLYKKADKALYTVKKNGKHGYAFFRNQDFHDAASEEADSSLSDVRMILGERNRKKGAYELDFEHFRTLYRFFIRCLDNYHYNVELVLFCFGSGVPGNAVDMFGNLLRQSLRRSDSYTKNGTRYIVLLPNPGIDHGESVISRVISNWNELNPSAPVTCSHEALTTGASQK